MHSISSWTAFRYERTEVLDDADVALLVTCAIREGAENKVFARLAQLNGLKKKAAAKAAPARKTKPAGAIDG